MINNRQGGRRRGRGGGGPRPNNVPSGNRQDNRQRGNAAQLLEKYKQLARDAQLHGDRVQSETYLQFAEHYFRVLGESRSRYDDQRRGRDDEYGDEDDGDDELAAGEVDDGVDEDVDRRPRRDFQDRDGRDRPREQQRDQQRDQPRDQPRDQQRDQQREQRPAREARPPREYRETREPRETREAREPREYREVRADEEPRNGEARFEPRRPRPRRELNGGDGAAAAEAQPGFGDAGARDEARIALDSLPPAISIAPAAPSDGDDDAPRPRRRTRRPRAEDGDTTPAAA